MKNYLNKIKLFFAKNTAKANYNINISSKEKINLLEQLSNLLSS
jgi:hypothetical protein